MPGRLMVGRAVKKIKAFIKHDITNLQIMKAMHIGNGYTENYIKYWKY